MIVLSDKIKKALMATKQKCCTRRQTSFNILQNNVGGTGTRTFCVKDAKQQDSTTRELRHRTMGTVTAREANNQLFHR